MNKEAILAFFTKPDKSFLGVCSKLSKTINVPSVAVRIAMILITLIFIPLGILFYFGFHILSTQNSKKMIKFGLIGAFLGIPLSYYFQSDIIKHYGGSSGVFGYLRNFFNTVERYDKFVGNGWDVVFNMFLSIVIFAVLGSAIGYYLNKQKFNKNE